MYSSGAKTCSQPLVGRAGRTHRLVPQTRQTFVPYARSSFNHVQSISSSSITSQVNPWGVARKEGVCCAYCAPSYRATCSNERETGNAKRREGGRSEPKHVCDSNGASGGRGCSVRKAATKAQIGANVWEPSVERPVSWRSTFHLNQEESWNHCVRSATFTGPNSLTTQMPKRQASNFTSTSQEVQTPTRSIDLHFSNELDEHTVALFGSRCTTVTHRHPNCITFT